MIKLWLNQNDIPALTAFAGNIDADSLKPFIFIAQTGDIKAILGVELYDKINTDYIDETLTGVYKEIYDNYVIYMLVYFACSHYIAMNSSKVSNNGIIKPEQSTDLKEIDRLSRRYSDLGNNVLLTFKDYMKTVNIPEWKYDCEATKRRDINVIDWY
jgi:hypothetical protein